MCYSNDAVYKFHLDLKQGMNPEMTPYPGNVTVNDDGIFYVTCNCYVLMYNAQGGYIDRWVAMSTDNKPSDKEDAKLSGLTIDNHGQLLVGQVDGTLSTHRQDGSHIGSIKVDIQPWYLAATSHDKIVISDWLNETVQIVDSSGYVQHTLKTNTISFDRTQHYYRQMSFWNPGRVTCHDDIILVCNSDTKVNHGCKICGTDKFYKLHFTKLKHVKLENECDVIKCNCLFRQATKMLPIEQN